MMRKVWFYSLGLIAIVLLLACAGPTPTPTPKPTPTPVPGVATPTPSPLLKAKQEAEAKGFIFETSHDDILAKARQEGAARELSGLDPGSIKPMQEAFVKKYPFINAYVEEITGTEAAQRFILEMKTGQVKGWGSVNVNTDFYNEYPPYMKKFDILGMAEHGVLGIVPQMIDPKERTIMAPASGIQVIAYNKKLLPPDKVPKSWEDLLKPEFKGKKFAVDIRPTEMAAFVPAWGLEKTLDFARKLAAQEPIWSRGHTRVLTAMAAGEYAILLGANYNSTARAVERDPTGSLGYALPEPVPARLTKHTGILASGPYPYASLLWLEFQASPEGQEILDKYEPFGSSLFAPGSGLEKLTRGKKLSVIGWDEAVQVPVWQEKVLEAYGFPKAEVK